MTLANWLTASRILLSPVFVIAFLSEGLWARIAALVIVVLSELTDGFDGHIARSRGEVTDLGKLLDPLADSISRLTVFVAFMSIGLIPWWMVLIFLYRDSAVSTLRTVCATKGLVLAARTSGKLKAIIQATVIIAILLARILELPLPGLFRSEWIAAGAWWAVLAAALWTAWSFVDYVGSNRVILAKVVTHKGSPA